MKCRCGHGRSWHRQSQNAVAIRRARGLRPTGHQSCWFKVRRDTSPYYGPRSIGPVQKCPCRNYVPQEA